MFWPKLQFQRRVFEALADTLPAEIRDEMAIPSYLHWNPLIRWIVAKRMRTVIAMLELKRDQALLDFGCGTGMLLLQLEPGFIHYSGADLELGPARTVLAAHGRNEARLFEKEAWNEEIDDHSLDGIVALEVLEHVDDVSGLAERFKAKLRPGGRLVVSGPTENAFYQLGRRLAGFSGEYHHRTIFDICPDLSAAGFVEDARRRLPFGGPLTAFVVLRFKTG